MDRDVAPLLVVKNYDLKKKTAKNCFLSIKVAKHSYQFAADSFKELREWAALIRQAIDNGKPRSCEKNIFFTTLIVCTGTKLELQCMITCKHVVHN